MKTFTIKQPWASLIVEGIKDIENRTWPCPKKYIGKRVLIHASAKNAGDYFNLLNAAQKNYHMAYRLANGYSPLEDLYLNNGCIIGSVDIIDCVINHPSVWAEKCEPIYKYGTDKIVQATYNWVLANPIKFPEPIPAKGKLSFWDYPNISAVPEEKGGMLYCHCQLPIDEKVQVANYGRGDFRCCYCGARWYK